jgi:hypothetical protein
MAATAAIVEFVILGTALVGKSFCAVVVNFAKDDELQVRDGRVAARTKLAEMQRVGDTA